MNYYEVLQLDGRASTEEIERAFRKLAREVHPDLASGDARKAEARMKQLNEIRDTLTDPLLRAGYDERLRLEDLQRQRAAPPPRPAAPPPRAERAPSARPHPLGEPGPPPPHRRMLAGAGIVVVGAAIAAAIVLLARAEAPAPFAPPPREVVVTDAAAAPLLAVPTTAASRAPAGAAEPPRPVRARVGGRGAIRLGSSVDDVFKAFGAPDRIERGAVTGDATFFYRTLRLEIKNGRVTGGDAAF